jgi:predicted small secreted protein
LQLVRDKKGYFMKKNPIMIAGLGLMALLAAGCNTVEGAGEDVEATGEVIEESAEEAGA